MKKYALINCNVLVYSKGQQFLKGHHIIVENGFITDITDDLDKTKGLPQIDLKGKYVLPGLINMHTHLPGNGKCNDEKQRKSNKQRIFLSSFLGHIFLYLVCKHYAKVELNSGVTTLRCVGGVSNIDSSLRDAFNKNRFLGPRLVVANRAITVKGGHMEGLVAIATNSNKEALNALDRVVKTKPDFIKIMITGGVLDSVEKGGAGLLKMPADMVKTICDKAHSLGFKVAAHIESKIGMEVAAENGVDYIEHGGSVDKKIIDACKKNNVSLILTTSTFLVNADIHSNDPSKYNSAIVFKETLNCGEAFKKAHLKVGLGNDVPTYFITHYNFWREMVLYKNIYKTTNFDAIYTATFVNASIMGLEDSIGSIEIGKSADMVVLNENPLDNLEAFNSVYKVVIRGRLVNKPKFKKFGFIDKRLDEISKNNYIERMELL